MTVSVACLTVAMAVVSGYETTLERAIIDVVGHVQVVKRAAYSQNIEDVLTNIKKAAPEVEAYTPFINVEGIVAGQGKLSGALIQGIDPATFDQVLGIRSRLIQGDFDLKKKDGVPSAVAGKALVRKFGLKVGETFKIVIPVPSRSDSTHFSPKVRSYVLSGVLDLGKAEYDERSIMVDLKEAQEFAGAGENFSGIRMKIRDAKAAPEVSLRLMRELGSGYWTMDWTEVNKNLFEAVKIERVAIFFVILVLVVAACFNIASGLFVSVLRRYGDISILRAMGFSRRDVSRIFVYQGLFFGVVGTVAGLCLGLLLGWLFVVAQKYIVLMPVEAYRLDHIGIDIRWLDCLAVVVAATVICLLSTLVPARRGAKLDPVEGLRYE